MMHFQILAHSTVQKFIEDNIFKHLNLKPQETTNMTQLFLFGVHAKKEQNGIVVDSVIFRIPEGKNTTGTMQFASCPLSNLDQSVIEALTPHMDFLRMFTKLYCNLRNPLLGRFGFQKINYKPYYAVSERGNNSDPSKHRILISTEYKANLQELQEMLRDSMEMYHTYPHLISEIACLGKAPDYEEWPSAAANCNITGGDADYGFCFSSGNLATIKPLLSLVQPMRDIILSALPNNADNIVQLRNKKYLVYEMDRLSLYIQLKHKDDSNIWISSRIILPNNLKVENISESLRTAIVKKHQLTLSITESLYNVLKINKDETISSMQYPSIEMTTSLDKNFLIISIKHCGISLCMPVPIMDQNMVDNKILQAIGQFCMKRGDILDLQVDENYNVNLLTTGGSLIEEKFTSLESVMEKYFYTKI